MDYQKKSQNSFNSFEDEVIVEYAMGLLDDLNHTQAFYVFKTCPCPVYFSRVRDSYVRSAYIFSRLLKACQ
jgi:hypothetical protein